MQDILYVNACVRSSEKSRTERLAQAYLAGRAATAECRITPVVLKDIAMRPLTEADLIARENAAQTGDFSGATFELARNFAAADEIVIAAPYWDMSFPALLKLYVEQLCVNKLTFCYNAQGMPCSLSRIRKAVYLTTAGGYIGSSNFGFEYIKGVFSTLFEITDIAFFSAEGLDIYGNDPEKLLADTIRQIHSAIGEK